MAGLAICPVDQVPAFVAANPVIHEGEQGREIILD